MEPQSLDHHQVRLSVADKYLQPSCLVRPYVVYPLLEPGAVEELQEGTDTSSGHVDRVIGVDGYLLHAVGVE